MQLLGFINILARFWSDPRAIKTSSLFGKHFLSRFQENLQESIGKFLWGLKSSTPQQCTPASRTDYDWISHPSTSRFTFPMKQGGQQPHCPGPNPANLPALLLCKQYLLGQIHHGLVSLRLEFTSRHITHPLTIKTKRDVGRNRAVQQVLNNLYPSIEFTCVAATHHCQQEKSEPWICHHWTARLRCQAFHVLDQIPPRARSWHLTNHASAFHSLRERNRSNASSWGFMKCTRINTHCRKEPPENSPKT